MCCCASPAEQREPEGLLKHGLYRFFMIVRLSSVFPGQMFLFYNVTRLRNADTDRTDALVNYALLYFMYLLQHNCCQVLMTVLPSKV